MPTVGAFIADIAGALATESFGQLSITLRHAEVAGGLPGPHRDPFDRMLITQALLEQLVFVSNEARFDAYGVSRLW